MKMPSLILQQTEFTITSSAGNHFSMDYLDVPIALTAHIQEISAKGLPMTAIVESAGQQWPQRESSDPNALAFVELVCQWGGKSGNRVWGNIQAFLRSDQITPGLISTTLQQSCRQGTIQAIQSVTGLQGLGYSFGSKILRMLRPDHWVVLDSVLNENLGYPLDDTGYYTICDHFRLIASEMNQRLIGNPMANEPHGVGRPNKDFWYPADVEAAIFARLLNRDRPHLPRFKPTHRDSEIVDSEGKPRVQLTANSSYTRIHSPGSEENLGYIKEQRKQTWITIYKNLNYLLPEHVEISRIPGFEPKYKSGGSAPLIGNIPFSDVNAAIQWLKCYFDVEG